MNLFALSSLLICFTNLSLAIFVLIKGKKNRVNIIWVCFCILIAVWGAGGYKFSTVVSEREAVFWWQIANIGSIFIPVLYCQFLFNFLDVKGKYHQSLLIASYLLGLIFLTVNFFYPAYFIGDLRLAFDHIFVTRFSYQNPLYLFFYIAFYWIFLAYCFGLIFLSYRKVKGIAQHQLKYILVASVIGWLGAHSGFIFVMRPDIYPYANFLIAVYPVIFTYAIIRHRLMDIQVVIKKSVVYSLSIGLLTAVFFIFVISISRYLSDISGFSSDKLTIASALVIAFLFNPLKNRIQLFVDKTFFKATYDYQKILKESIKAVVTMLDLSDLLYYIIDVIRKSLGVQKACVFIREEDGLCRMKASLGVSKETTSKYIMHESIIKWIEQERAVFVREEQEMLLSEESFSAVYKDLDEIGAEIIIPLFCKGNLNGVLALGHKGNAGQYMQSDIDLIEALASQASIAIENARLYEEAITDGLTGLYRNKYFKFRLHEEIERARRYRHPLSLLMIDVDYFKNVNDEHGHLAGDKVLREVAKAWKEKIRVGDILARYGGEEFALILPETAVPDALKMAENLRSLTEGKIIDGISITISIGISFCDEKSTATDYNRLIHCADQALYRSKHRGRNRIELVN